MVNSRTYKKGFALSIVLWIVAALLLGVATLSIFAKDSLQLSKGIDHKLNTRIAAENVLEILKFYLLTASNDQVAFHNENLKNTEYTLPAIIVVDNRWYQISENIKFRIDDNGNKVSLSYLSPNFISGLLKNYVSRQEVYILKDSLEDWVDKDNVPSLNGAEMSQYKLKEGLNYSVRNSPAVQDIQELKLINGFRSLNSEQWNILKQNICYGDGGRPNLFFVSPEYLQMLLRLDQETAVALVKIRQKDHDKFEKIVKEMKIYDDESLGFYISKNLFIQIEVTNKQAKTILEVQLDIKNYLTHDSHRIIRYVAR